MNTIVKEHLYGMFILTLAICLLAIVGCEPDSCEIDTVPQFVKEGKITNLLFVGSGKSMQFTFADGQVVFISEIEKESLEYLRIGQTGKLLLGKIKNNGCLCGSCKHSVYYWEISEE